jgi:hypothetical protein
LIDSSSGSLVSSRKNRLVRGGLERARDFVQRTLKFGTDALQAENNANANDCGDKAVFDRGCARLVLQEPNKRLHSTSPNQNEAACQSARSLQNPTLLQQQNSCKLCRPLYVNVRLTMGLT